MVDPKETCLDYLDCDKYAVFSSSEKKWINKLHKLKERFPEQVEILCEPDTNFGELVAKIPKNWFRITPPAARQLTEEQKKMQAERLAAARQKKSSSEHTVVM